MYIYKIVIFLQSTFLCHLILLVNCSSSFFIQQIVNANVVSNCSSIKVKHLKIFDFQTEKLLNLKCKKSCILSLITIK